MGAPRPPARFRAASDAQYTALLAAADADKKLLELAALLTSPSPATEVLFEQPGSLQKQRDYLNYLHDTEISLHSMHCAIMDASRVKDKAAYAYKGLSESLNLVFNSWRDTTNSIEDQQRALAAATANRIARIDKAAGLLEALRRDAEQQGAEERASVGAAA